MATGKLQTEGKSPTMGGRDTMNRVDLKDPIESFASPPYSGRPRILPSGGDDTKVARLAEQSKPPRDSSITQDDARGAATRTPPLDDDELFEFANNKGARRPFYDSPNFSKGIEGAKQLNIWGNDEELGEMPQRFSRLQPYQLNNEAEMDYSDQQDQRNQPGRASTMDKATRGRSEYDEQNARWKNVQLENSILDRTYEGPEMDFRNRARKQKLGKRPRPQVKREYGAEEEEESYIDAPLLLRQLELLK